MKKIIVLGDIHGNLPALEVALREARAEGYDLLVHTGDLVGFAPFPDETVERIRAERIQGVRGNLDESVAAGAEEFGVCDTDAARRAFEEKAYEWTLGHTERLTRQHLANLPFELRLTIGGRRGVLVHATPLDAYTCLGEERDEDYFREMGDAGDADILVFGHTHRPYHRIVDGRHFVNAGSVGFSGDGDARACYAVIQANGNVEVQYRRFPYDTDRLLTVAAARRFPLAGSKFVT
ncbi:MAG TPA: YfcE family phosphodiesterase [Candidatus Polarisedimenticolia bacterium]|nr:YfcE family phosphodiesterase [Candidatus Polarisedimenticolia bacterium]